ncbi:hypothetical protein SH580_20695 [Coraliomargarita algicola]|uniref:ABC transmembrane type-1 domain-containing protein n=1 Tax=Coraliomargarita algicola TaxID=3092156 RepID=A0ABZ0RSA2_9BACT|nr:hypothetical protein [Coraliomargarita sp. J2-16]WPJ95839.1 hypothetical protein SH580_20695 [Coraliomargarita sp. J2-16]
MSDSNQAPTKKAAFLRWLPRAKLYLALYALCLPTVVSLAIFSYYPKIDVFIMSFFRWQPPTVQEFVGFKNFIEAFADPQFWSSFKLVGILLVANLIKLWPGIFAAIALHRLFNDKMRYFFQVCFVVPMIVPMMVWLLIWKSFYDPEFGLLNRFLNLTGGMKLLDWMDSAMPALALKLQPVVQGVINPVFGGIAGLILLGGLIMVAGYRKDRSPARWGDYAYIIAGALILPIFMALPISLVPMTLLCLLIIYIVWMVLLARRLGKSWIAWPLLLLAGTAVFSGALLRYSIALIVAFTVFEIVRARWDFFTGGPVVRRIGLGVLSVGIGFVVFGALWTEPLLQFKSGTPAWLGSSELVVPALIFWGFPWVGTVGVLIYLSGLQGISQDVYEAAELDGVGPIDMLFRIELPLIMTQVRINLIFMTIGTLTAYEIFLILLGPEGGPGNKGMVPGLYMFSSAFAEGRFGYACALGMVLFVIILILTIIYQRYVKVDK